MRRASVIIMFCTEAINYLPQIVTYTRLSRKNGGTKGYKGSTMMQAL